MSPHYAIGIDLGTSNCALAFIDLGEKSGEPRMLRIRQMETGESMTEQAILPSFLYFPTEAEEERIPPDGTFKLTSRPVVAGRFARRRAADLPGRVIHSAKSWLCHPGVDREGPILPWHSEEIPSGQRLSPVEASAHYLALLRSAWQAVIGTNPDTAFERQEIVITVPASFDEASQRLTLEAAAQAGFPRRLRLLEEPQAAFYHWLNLHGQGRELLKLLPRLGKEPQLILICDVGGGTSDFSLFRVDPLPSGKRVPAIQRVEVSDHLLLGGDNMDLALAHALEQKLAVGERKLAAGQWHYLLAESRRLKEQILGSDDGGPGQSFSISIPGTGARLFAGTLTVQVTRQEVEALVIEGFFPECSREQHPSRASSGLKELGLPYAADPGITRHLAAFLRGRPIDAVLFTGGALKPRRVRQRLIRTLGGWQADRPIIDLANDDLDLAVARGAACYAEILHQPYGRITGGYPHSLYLEIQARGRDATPRLVCILPKGFEEGEAARVENLNLKLLVGKPVRFQPYFSTFRGEDRPGDVVEPDADVYRPLPSLQTGIALQEGLAKPSDGRLPVILETTLNELGLLQVACVHTTAEERSYRWDLEFNLRKADAETVESGDAGVPPGPGVSEKTIEAATGLIAAVYGKKRGKEKEIRPRRLARELEALLGVRKQDWNLLLLRSLWPAFEQGMTLKSRSPDHEATWLNLAGWVLRPGYGADLDPFRIDQLWRLSGLGLSFPREKRVVNQWYILWRRVAGGLDRDQQETILAPLLRAFENLSAEGAELFRLVGSLERVNQETRETLAARLTRMIERGEAQGTGDAIWALGRLLSRVPLYAGPDAVIRPQVVDEVFSRLARLDWRKEPRLGLSESFSRACRMTGQRHHDVSEELREKVLEKLEASGARPEHCRVVREFVPVEMADQANLFGESFPAGLILF